MWHFQLHWNQGKQQIEYFKFDDGPHLYDLCTIICISDGRGQSCVARPLFSAGIIACSVSAQPKVWFTQSSCFDAYKILQLMTGHTSLLFVSLCLQIYAYQSGLSDVELHEELHITYRFLQVSRMIGLASQLYPSYCK